MDGSLLKVFLFLAILAVTVNAQNDTSNVIADCIKKYDCGTDDGCRAACAGVPFPTPDIVNKTQDCYKNCGQTKLPDNDAYVSCTDDCRTKIFQQDTTKPGSPKPSGSGASSGGNSEDNTSSSENTTDGNASSEDNKNQSNTSDSAFVSVSSTYVYAFAAVLACAALGVGL